MREALARDFGNDAFESAAAVVDAGGGVASARANGAPSPSGSPAAAGTVVIPLGDSGDPEGSGGDGDADRARQRGWELAHWAVAHSSRLGVERVSYAGREWIAEGRAGAWRKARSAAGGVAGSAVGSSTEVRIVTGQ